MAFLDKSMLRESSGGGVVEKHPLLENENLPLSVIKMYVTGCVFAVLVDDAKVDDDERLAVVRIGKSLQMDDASIDECFDLVQALPECDRGGFVSEMLMTLSQGIVGCSFLLDFEKLLLLHETISEENYRLLDEFGLRLTGKQTWREEVDRIEMPSVVRAQWEKHCDIASRAGNQATIESMQRITEKRWKDRWLLLCGTVRTWLETIQENGTWCCRQCLEQASKKWHGYPIWLVIVAGILGAALAVLVLYLVWLLLCSIWAFLCWLGWVNIPVFFLGASAVWAGVTRGLEGLFWGVVSGFWSIVVLIAILIKIFN